MGNQAFREGNRKVLVVLGSGLQTTGALSMTDGKFHADPADLVQFAADHGELPALDGVEVRMPQFGVVTEPQPAMTEDARGQLSDIWTAYFAASKAASVYLAPSTLTPRPLQGSLPTVTPIQFVRPTLDPPTACAQRLEQSTVNFESGSATLKDEAGTRATLTAAVAGLAGCVGDYRIEASASSEGEQSANEVLSEQR